MVKKNEIHYPMYDVMSQHEHWDEHTRSIVSSRIVREDSYHFLNAIEIEILRSWCARLMDDDRGEIITYVLGHIDRTLFDNKGEGQRKPHVPPAPILIRTGLNNVHKLAESLYGNHFWKLSPEIQHSLMTDISEGTGQQGDEHMQVPPKDFFQKLLIWTVESYYSHPKVWSEIGFGGPAYPRGYVRLAPGQVDPWEATNKS
ncbi:gluconate 2-dehydrogenase subunit 3 family protein [Paenibacillus sp. N1-5-1-14]|uniref:gluconate 2-dehydrogenase subunit 3 family protein n=1 Tax=Paenibacillus radicibacter TaxID=2972488 RepID=UPI0021594252|nr:gluconate 2-dehydrogenase subunit 3 family protein [Paenibacillus radicibacter]MCR8643320.1 gluconate 2-dehydrogenase subunit 3 family protein [Paenibacillus radicibacter]